MQTPVINNASGKTYQFLGNIISGVRVGNLALSLILSVGYKAENKLYEEIKNTVDDAYVIGDAKSVKNIMSAIWDAYEIARGI